MSEAEPPLSFEELVDLALSFLQDELGGERCLVVHPDLHRREPVVQAHVGFGPQAARELDIIRFDWLSRSAPKLVEWQAGRSILGCPLALPGQPAFGLLYSEHTRARFQKLHLKAMSSFAREYTEALLELLASPPEPEPPPQPPPERPLPAFPIAIPEDEPDPVMDWRLLVVDWI